MGASGDEMRANNIIERRDAAPADRCACRDPGRRDFLGALSALGAAAVLPSCASPTPPPYAPISAGAAGTASVPGVPLIDTHHHFYAPEYQEAWLAWENKRNLPHFPTQVAWSRDKSIEEMDRNNV